jgi:L-threonylcarbamoyladenylate synthase
MSGKATERLPGDKRGVERAAAILREGGLVAVPTETVYGLAARADSDRAVAGIFAAKGRPDFNPLIVHVSSLEDAKGYAQLDSLAEQLALEFWPGPLTLVLPARKDNRIAAAVTAGLPTVALRMPNHPLTTALLSLLRLPLAAPSANRSGAVSPTSPEHVVASLGGGIDAVLDAGPTAQGLESTIVLSLGNGRWRLLRPGPISEDLLRVRLGEPVADTYEGIQAPGQLASHYSPGKPLRLDAASAERGEFLIGFGAMNCDCNLSPSGHLAEAASRLYACLHEAAASSQVGVAVAPVPTQGLGAAINDRLRRAAA